MAILFDSSHNEAFRELGAIEPGQHWSSFDVKREQARKGEATLFVTTIWNYHSTIDKDGRRISTDTCAITKDPIDGSLWYRVTRQPGSKDRKTAIAHWEGLKLALQEGIPIIGILKDVHTSRCSLKHLFDCDSPRYESDENTVWIQLHPRGGTDFEVEESNVPQSTTESLDQRNQRFTGSVDYALKLSDSERKDRLSDAQKIPKRIEARVTVFDRNQHVVAEALLRADGICEYCKQPAPFIRRSNGTPYLEVHHVIHLAKGGEDTIENAVALCPNCHREAHYA